MRNGFYNTINLHGRELTQAQKHALSQEQKILRYFIAQCKQEPCRSPSEIRSLCFDDRVPLTSVRRGMTNLTQSGDLLKCERMIKGQYGKPEHLWTVSAKWNVSTPRQGELL